MTEAEWHQSMNALAMLSFLRFSATERKFRIFACRCLRSISEALPHETDSAIRFVENYLENNYRWGATTKRARKQVSNKSPLKWLPNCLLFEDPHYSALETAYWTCVYLGRSNSSFNWREFLNLWPLTDERTIEVDSSQLVPYVLDIFDNPFHPIACDPRWQTSTAVGLARTMYDARDFGAMPILADALQDAGCEDDAILNHCRDPHQVHVRGCWVVDGVLGKS